MTKIILKIRKSGSRECQELDQIIQIKVCDMKIFQIIEKKVEIMHIESKQIFYVNR